MNYQTRLERLRERFLRANTKPLFESACVEGGAILIHGAECGFWKINQELQPMIAGTRIPYDSIEPMQAAIFRSYALLNTRDRTFKMVLRTSDVVLLAERYAAFCLEMIDFIGLPTERDDDELHQKALTQWNAGETWRNICEKLSGDGDEWKAFSQAVKRYAKRQALFVRTGSPGTKSKRNE